MIAGVALLAFATPAARYINVALGVWLIASAFSFPRVSGGTVWNDVIVGMIVGLFALVGPAPSGNLVSHRVSERRS